jgi:hypothetical protein
VHSFSKLRLFWCIPLKYSLQIHDPDEGIHYPADAYDIDPMALFYGTGTNGIQEVIPAGEDGSNKDSSNLTPSDLISLRTSRQVDYFLSRRVQKIPETIMTCSTLPRNQDEVQYMERKRGDATPTLQGAMVAGDGGEGESPEGVEDGDEEGDH